MESHKLIEYAPVIYFLLAVFGAGYMIGNYFGYRKSHKEFKKLHDEYIEIIEEYKEIL